MGLMLLVIGIFAGLFVFIATTYSLAQAMLTEGRLQIAHLAALLATCAVMAALYMGYVPVARILALPLLGISLWTFWLEERWFKVFPMLHQLFAVVVLLGFVAI
ncbi:MAG: hypothetical protein AAF074_26225 [Pseudomonadota bacterium]